MAVFVADEQVAVPVAVESLRALASHVLVSQRVPEAMELSLLFVDRDAIAALNAHHMDKQGPTDVLAFPIDLPGETIGGEPTILGDVVVCPEIAAGQAAERDVAVEAELELLVVHGILHLLGHDHAQPAERAAMFGLTDQLLARFHASVGDGSAGSGMERRP